MVTILDPSLNSTLNANSCARRLGDLEKSNLIDDNINDSPAGQIMAQENSPNTGASQPLSATNAPAQTSPLSAESGMKSSNEYTGKMLIIPQKLPIMQMALLGGAGFAAGHFLLKKGHVYSAVLAGVGIVAGYILFKPKTSSFVTR